MVTVTAETDRIQQDTGAGGRCHYEQLDNHCSSQEAGETQVNKGPVATTPRTANSDSKTLLGLISASRCAEGGY